MAKAYYLYIDDSGSRFPDRKSPIDRDDHMDCFALGGILIENSARAALGAAHEALCNRWNITTPLHSSTIRGRRRDFSWLDDDGTEANEFLADLEQFLCDLPVIGFATVIDRAGYNARYRERYGDQRWWMCKSAYTILIERVAKYVDSQGGAFQVRFEETGKKEDRALIGYAKDLKRTGAPFDPQTSAEYGALSAIDFKRIIQGEPRRLTKASPAIQVADLYLYPMVKAGYDPTYRPFLKLMECGRIIDAVLPEGERANRGIKYSCFELVKNERPGKTQA